LFGCRQWRFDFRKMLACEELTAEARGAERDRLRRIIAELPRTSPTAIFLAGTASQLLEVQFRVEDVLRSATSLTVTPAQADGLAAVVGGIRQAVPACSDIFGRLVVGARFDLANVNESLAVEEPIPGISPALLQSLRASQVKLEGSQRSSQSVGNFRLRRQQQAAEAAANAVAAVHAPVMVAPLPLPVPAGNRRPPNFSYPCDACGAYGHWKNQGLCKPVDVQRQLAKLAAMAAAVAPGTPPPPGIDAGMFLAFSIFRVLLAAVNGFCVGMLLEYCQGGISEFLYCWSRSQPYHRH